MRIGSSLSLTLIGLRACFIRIQAFISPGLPYFDIIGLPDASLTEARERVKAAICACGIPWPQTRLIVNLSPASLPKHGSAHDVAIAVAILQASGAIPRRGSDKLMLGELNLDGSILPVHGVLPALLYARERGIREAWVPRANCDEAHMVEGIRIRPLDCLSQVITLLGGHSLVRTTTRRTHTSLARVNVNKPEQKTAQTSDSLPLTSSHQDTHLDFADVIGQDEAKRALEICAAGEHHILMSGPPGAGKTMLAQRLPTILPPLDEQAALEVASIRSLCGTLARYGITRTPPFEAPHHTASPSAIAGGGALIAHPGAVTRAHHGVLFLDEAPEFSSAALQCLREPLETGCISLSRSRATTLYPAQFLLVMAANPCPCGKGWGSAKDCTCTVQQRRRYWNRLTGPLLDRIDIQIEVPPAPRYLSSQSHHHTPVESSAHIRQRVCQARQCAQQRFAGCGWSTNGRADARWLKARTSVSALQLLDSAVQSETLTVRGADRALRLAWTISDLDGTNSPGVSAVAEAIEMRNRRK
jgi:magnesium chelatase family protein